MYAISKGRVSVAEYTEVLGFGDVVAEVLSTSHKPSGRKRPHSDKTRQKDSSRACDAPPRSTKALTLEDLVLSTRPTRGDEAGGDARNAHVTPLIIAEDNEAVIKILQKGRTSALRHVLRSHRISIHWLIECLRKESIRIIYMLALNYRSPISLPNISPGMSVGCHWSPRHFSSIPMMPVCGLRGFALRSHLVPRRMPQPAFMQPLLGSNPLILVSTKAPSQLPLSCRAEKFAPCLSLRQPRLRAGPRRSWTSRASATRTTEGRRLSASVGGLGRARWLRPSRVLGSGSLRGNFEPRYSGGPV